MMRIRYPAVVDFAYSASAPMLFYSQHVNQFDYYRVVTDSARKASAGCPAAVQQMLQKSLVGKTKAEIVSSLGLCTPLPAYMDQGDVSVLVNEINMVVMYTFADLNMGNYPPPNTTLQAACMAIEATVATNPAAALSQFLQNHATAALTTPRPHRASPHRVAAPSACFNMTAQLPSGPNATISAGDWSGVGTG